MEPRQARALHIAATTALAPNNGRWKVPSQNGHGSYTVTVTADGSWFCSCPDHEETLAPCKHIMAVEVTIQRETGRGGQPFSEVVKVTYSQNWPAYNAAQCDEKRMFLKLLGDLCAGVPQPQGAATGRPRLPLSDMAFAVIHKAYAGTSARRFTTDLREAQEKGLISRSPSFNSVLNYQRDTDLTPLLTSLVELSALPLKAIEQDFAIDSSGFGTKGTKTWFSTKHGKTMESRDCARPTSCAGWASSNGRCMVPVMMTGARTPPTVGEPQDARRALVLART